MSDAENQNQPKVKADQGSISTAFEVGGNIENSNVNISNVINNYNSPDPARSLFVSEIIETQNFEPETILIPEGPFMMGSDPGDGIPVYDTPRHEVSLPAYRISKYPVTNSQYYEFVLQGGPVNSEMKWEGRNVRYGFEDMPVTGVKLDDARKYCDWLNSRVTDREYKLPNEAQLEKAYQGPYGCSDVIDNLYQWTCTLWGAKGNAPDPRYRYPWKDDGRNNINMNSQIRRIVYAYIKQGGPDSPRIRQRSGQFPDDVGFPGARHGFRVVMVGRS